MRSSRSKGTNLVLLVLVVAFVTPVRDDGAAAAAAAPLALRQPSRFYSDPISTQTTPANCVFLGKKKNGLSVFASRLRSKPGRTTTPATKSRRGHPKSGRTANTAGTLQKMKFKNLIVSVWHACLITQHLAGVTRRRDVAENTSPTRSLWRDLCLVSRVTLVCNNRHGFVHC